MKWEIWITNWVYNELHEKNIEYHKWNKEYNDFEKELHYEFNN